MHLAIVIDLYSLGIIGWHTYKRMTTSLASRVLIKVQNIRRQRQAQFFIVAEGYNIPASVIAVYYRALIFETV